MILPRLALAILLAGLLPSLAGAEDAPRRHHAFSLIGEPRYKADFSHFDFVNPDAPKGGLVRLGDIGGFDSLNPVLYRGEQAGGLGLVFETLMSDSLDEPSTSYGLIAEWASYPEDYSSVTFKLRDAARWHDGKKITPEDVIYSLEVNKAANPRMGLYYKNVSRAEATGDNEVTFYFDAKNNRELPMIMGQLTILPKHYWTGTDASGNQRDPMKTTLEPPLGSGPYRIKDVKPGRAISYERVTDYWAKDLPVNAGQWNYDEIRFEYYRDETVAFESFKAGNLDYWQETSAKNWATAYDFATVKNGFIRRQEVPVERTHAMQCFVLNLRRPQFEDRRVRQAFNLAFDFEWANKNLFYDQYARVGSYFEGGELAAPDAAPEGRELEILNEVKDGVPPEVFNEIHRNPVNDNPDAMRGNLRKAVTLLEGGGLGGQERRAHQRQDRSANEGRVPARVAPVRAHRAALLAQSRAARHQGHDPHGGFGAIHAAARRVRLRHRGRQFRSVRLARQRAARLLGLGGRRPGRQHQPYRRQEPGDR